MEMISPFQLYLILQLDAFRFAAGLIATFSFVIVVVLTIFALTAYNADPEKWESPDFKRDEQRTLDRAPIYAKWAKIAGFGLFLPAMLIGILLPSTKTAAAIVVIPAIANNATVQQEASELYQLAKSALADAVDLPAEPAVPVQEEE